MTNIILIRHGESLGNNQKIYLGQEDWDLSPTGYKQAELVAQKLKTIHIDKIYSSDLIRAYHTVEPTAKALGMEIIKEKNLREIDSGSWGGLTYDELQLKFKNDYGIWCSDIGHAICTNGESVADLWQRIGKCIQKIAEENIGKTILIATHATPIRTLVTDWSGKTIDDMKNIPWVYNASLTYAKFDNGKFSVTSVNDCEHLKDLVTIPSRNV